MAWLLYLIWIVIPTGLLLLGVLYRLRQFVLPRPDDDLTGPFKILWLGRLWLGCGILSLLIDWLLVWQGGVFLFSSPLTLALRLLLLPLLVVLALLIGWLRRLASVDRESNRFKLELRGSSTVMLGIGILFIALLLSERQWKERYLPWLAGARLEDERRIFQVGTVQQAGTYSDEKDRDAQGLIGEVIQRLRGWLDNLAESSSAKKGFKEGVSGSGHASKAFFKAADFNKEAYRYFRPIIREAARQNSVDPDLAEALAEIGSGYNANYVLDNQFFGLMQLSLSNVQAYKLSDPLDPMQNIRVAMKVLAALEKKYAGNHRLVLAAYRVGEALVDQYQGPPPQPEVKMFVKRVMSLYELLQAHPR